MDRNWIKYLGFLGLLGLLGFFTPNAGFYGFFGFFGFFFYKNIKFDERFSANLNKAARNAFLFSILLFIVSTILATIAKSDIVYIYTVGFGFGLQVLIFSLSFSYYEGR